MTPLPTVAGKVMAILNAFLPDDEELTLSEICRRSGLPLATGHRLVGELVRGAYLERLPRGGYRAGLRLWRAGAAGSTLRDLRELALPYMADLYTLTRENVQLTVRRDDRALNVERLRGPQSVPVRTRVAGEPPLHATAAGKVLLAFAPPEVTDRVLAGELTAYTPHTIVDPVRLRAELAAVRRARLACTYEEMRAGTCSVAVPVWAGAPGERGSEVVAALSLVLWRHGGDPRRFAAPLREAAQALSTDLYQAFRSCSPWPGARSSGGR